MEREKKEKKEWDGQGEGYGADFKRWVYTRFLGYVNLKEYVQFPEYAEDGHRYTREERPYDCAITYRLVKKKDLPPEATKCSGEPYDRAIDRAQIVHMKRTKGDWFTAHMGWLYMEYGGFDKCLAKDWNDLDHLNLKKIALIGAVVIGVAVVFLMMRGH